MTKFVLEDTARHKKAADMIKRDLQQQGFKVRVKKNASHYYKYQIYRSSIKSRGSGGPLPSLFRF